MDCGDDLATLAFLPSLGVAFRFLPAVAEDFWGSSEILGESAAFSLLVASLFFFLAAGFLAVLVEVGADAACEEAAGMDCSTVTAEGEVSGKAIGRAAATAAAVPSDCANAKETLAVVSTRVPFGGVLSWPCRRLISWNAAAL